MTQFGSLYSLYYDLIYSDKDYAGEVEYIDSLIKMHKNDAKILLDMGCGTGRHAELFCDRGYTVHGVDVSEDMLKIAQARCKGKENKLQFSLSSIQNVKLNEKFDVVTSLFHVISYQNSNTDLKQAFVSIKEHLKKDGIFIFDFWYGPAVLTDLPAVRIKKFESDRIKVTRIAEPFLYAEKNIVDVNYTIFIENKESKEVVEKKELHRMRYFFDTELELIFEMLQFDILCKYEWMTYKKPGFDSWYVVWVVTC